MSNGTDQSVADIAEHELANLQANKTSVPGKSPGKPASAEMVGTWASQNDATIRQAREHFRSLGYYIPGVDYPEESGASPKAATPSPETATKPAKLRGRAAFAGLDDEVQGAIAARETAKETARSSRAAEVQKEAQAATAGKVKLPIVQPSLTGKVYGGLSRAATKFFEEEPTPVTQEARRDQLSPPTPAPPRPPAEVIRQTAPPLFRGTGFFGQNIPLVDRPLSERAARVGESMIQLPPPEGPSQNQEYWEHEYAARTRDLAKIADEESRQRAETSAEQERQKQIARLPLERRVALSLTDPGTLLGDIGRKAPPKVEFESDYFKHRQAEAERAGKSIWDEFPKSISEALLRGSGVSPRVARQAGTMATKPILGAKTIAGQAGPFGEGAIQALTGFTSPENLMLAGSLGELSNLATGTAGFLRQSPRIVSALFATSMGASLVDAAHQYEEAGRAGDTATQKRILGSAAVLGPMTLLMAYHAATPQAPTVVALTPKDLVEKVGAATTMSRETVGTLRDLGYTNQQISFMSVADLDRILGGRVKATPTAIVGEPEAAPAEAAAPARVETPAEAPKAPVKPPVRVPVVSQPPTAGRPPESQLLTAINQKDWWHVPPAEGTSAYGRRGQFFATSFKEAEFYGRPLDEPQHPQVKNPLVGTEQVIASRLGIPPEREGMSIEEIADHDAKWAKAAKNQGYDAIVLMTEKGWSEYNATGKIPKSMELNLLTEVKEPRQRVPVVSRTKEVPVREQAVPPETKAIPVTAEEKPPAAPLVPSEERRVTEGVSPTGTERRVATLPLAGVTGPPPEQVRLISEARKLEATGTPEEKALAREQLKQLEGTEAGLAIAAEGGEKMAEGIRQARAAAPPTPITPETPTQALKPGDWVTYADDRGVTTWAQVQRLDRGNVWIAPGGKGTAIAKRAALLTKEEQAPAMVEQIKSAGLAAYDLGAAAFKAGLRRVPAEDEKLKEIVSAAIPGGKYKEWLRGWDEANLAKPVGRTLADVEAEAERVSKLTDREELQRISADKSQPLAVQTAAQKALLGPGKSVPKPRVPLVKPKAEPVSVEPFALEAPPEDIGIQQFIDTLPDNQRDYARAYYNVYREEGRDEAKDLVEPKRFDLTDGEAEEVDNLLERIAKKPLTQTETSAIPTVEREERGEPEPTRAEAAREPSAEPEPAIPREGVLAEEPAAVVPEDGRTGLPARGEPSRGADIAAREAGIQPERGERGGVPEPVPGAGVEPERKPRAARRRVPQLTPSTKPAGNDYQITAEDHLGEGGQIAKYKDNVAAIKLLKQLQAENRNATPEEQRVLAKYVGWGGISDVFAYWKPEWKARYDELKGLLTDEEWDAASGSTQTAFYTSEDVVRFMYDALKKLGFENGRMLEPAAGTGNFLGLMPPEMAADSKRMAVEIEPLAGAMLKQLYQNAEVRISPFEKVKTPANFFDLVITNVPFSDVKPFDPAYDKLKLNLHNYFLVRGLDTLRPGGVMAVITSHYSMDSSAPDGIRGRKLIADRADLIDAYRLPSTAFKGNANTEVVTDVLFLQKRAEGAERGGEDFQTTQNITIKPDGSAEVASYQTGYRLNEYYLRHPDHILGKLSTEGTMYQAREMTVQLPAAEIPGRLEQALAKVPEGAYEKPLPTKTTRDQFEQVVADRREDVKPFGHTIKEGKVFQYDQVGEEVLPSGERVPKFELVERSELTKKQVQLVNNALALRDATRDIFAAELRGEGGPALAGLRSKLNTAYENFVKRHGFVNDTAASRLLHEDPDYPLLQALENWDADKGTATKADIFSRRVVSGKVAPIIKSPRDAMLHALSEYGKLDWDIMGSLLGTSPEEVQAKLMEEGLVFRNPEGAWETADDYLSGNVRKKFEAAEAAAGIDKQYERNRDALKNLVPKDLTPGEIHVRMGSTWVPPDVIQDFMREILRVSADVTYTPNPSRWIQHIKYGKETAENAQTWGTQDFYGSDLIDMALNLKEPIARDRVPGTDKTQINVDRTLAAQEKQRKLMERFSDWVWEDSDRATRLGRLYNDAYNSVIPWKADGQHLTIPSLAAGLSIHPWVKDGIWRILRRPTAYIAYEVGLGKTLVYLGGALEAKRIGRFRKPMIVAHNATVEGYRKDAQRFFPGQKILVVTNEDLESGNRQRFMSRIATGDWDAVIVPHSSFGLLPVRPETYERFLMTELRAARHWFELNKGDMDRRTVKQIEKAMDRVENRINRKIDTLKKKQDVTIFFEDLGVDALLTDESDAFKNLMFNTQMRRVAGLGNPIGSDRALDLLMKSRFVMDRNNGPGLYFASGTPLSNTIAEIFGIQRYLMPKELEEMGLGQFDAWAAQFGNVVSNLESSPEDPTRFRIVKSFAEFNNLPDLARMWNSVADYRTADAVGLKRPKVKTDYRALEPSPEQRNYVKVELSERADKVRHREVDPSVDNMLNVTTDGRKSALDMRLVDPTAADFPQSKLNGLVRDVEETWRATADRKGVQLIALDFSTPADRTPGKFMAYRDITEKLVRRGVPRDQIAWIHDYNTPDKFRKFTTDVNEGRIRVVLGSTNKMGVGINIQQRAVGIHHLDVGWRPRDLTQRLGRVQRQGNENPEVFERFWTTKETFDAYMLQKNETKQKFINSFLSGELTQRKGVEDIGGRALTFGEIKAITTGRPEVMEKIHVDVELDKLQRLASQHNVEQRNLKVALAKNQASIDELKRDIALIEQDAKSAGKPEEFSMTLGRKSFTERKDAGAALIQRLVEADNIDHKHIEQIGTYGGLDVMVEGWGKAFPAAVFLRGKFRYGFSRSEDPVGIIRSMEHQIETIPDTIRNMQEAQERLGIDSKEIQSQIGKPFSRQGELDSLITRSNQLAEILGQKEGDAQAAAAEEKPEAEEPPETEQEAADDAFGSGNKVFTKDRADAARKRFRDKAFKTMAAGIDPTMLKDLIEIGGFYIEAGIRDFAEWSRRMLRQFRATGLNPDIEPRLQEIYDMAVNRGEKLDPGFAANIRLENLDTADEVIEVIKETARVQMARIQAQRRGKVSWAQTKQTAQQLVNDGQITVKDLENMKKGTALNDAQLKAARSILVSLSEDVAKKLEAFRKNDSRENLLSVMAAVKKQRAVQAAVSGATAEAGRALNQMKIAAEAIRAKSPKEKVLDMLGGDISEEMVRRLAQIDEKDYVALNRFVRDHAEFTTYDKLNAYWLANILSSWWTSIRINTSSFVFSAANLISRPLAGLVDKPISKMMGIERVYTPGETLPALIGLFEGIPEGFRKTLFIMQNGIDPDSAKFLDMPRFYRFPGGLRNPLNWTGRAVMASHWFWRSISTTSELNAIAARKALRAGTQGALKRYFEARRNFTPEDIEQAKNFGRYVGFADPPGQLTRMLLRLRNWQIPEDWFVLGGLAPLRYVVPFINIATNIAKASFELSPAGLLRLLSGKTRAKPGAASHVIAMALVGSAVLATIATYFTSDQITGQYPKDAGRREEWKRLGKKPYSVRIGNRWLPYLHWSGPLGPGIAAIAEAKQQYEETGRTVSIDVVAPIATSIGRSMADQSFFRGIANLMDAMREGGPAATRFLEDIAAGMIPFISAQRSLALQLDPYAREAKGPVEYIERGIPVVSKRLPPQRTVFGEPVPSGLTGKATQDPVTLELQRLGIRPGGLGDKIVEKKIELDMNAQGRDYYRNRVGVILHDTLRETVASPEYKEMNDYERSERIDSEIRRVRTAGRIFMLRTLVDHPEFRAEPPYKLRIPFARKVEAQRPQQ